MKNLMMCAVLLAFAPAVSAEEQSAPPAQAEGHNDGPDFRKIYNRFQNMSPEDKKKFLAEHPHFRERFANAVENHGERVEQRGEKLENRGERLDEKGERLQARGERIGGERGERLERRGERMERRGERMERRGERMERRGERIQRRAGGARGGAR